MGLLAASIVVEGDEMVEQVVHAIADLECDEHLVEEVLDLARVPDEIVQGAPIGAGARCHRSELLAVEGIRMSPETHAFQLLEDSLGVRDRALFVPD